MNCNQLNPESSAVDVSDVRIVLHKVDFDKQSHLRTTDNNDEKGQRSDVNATGEETESDEGDDDISVGSDEGNSIIHESRDEGAEECQEPQNVFSEAFTSLAELEDHVRARGELKCKHCNAEFEIKSALIEHLKNEHSCKDILPCGLCPAIFDTALDLAVHSKQNHAFDGYRCGICGKFYQIQCELQEHEDEHAKDSERKVFKCIYCPENFSNSNYLFQHSKHVHNVVKFKCGICRLFFQNDRDFLQHRATHSVDECNQFPFLCEKDKPAEPSKKELMQLKEKELQMVKQAQNFNQFVALQMIYSQINEHDLRVKDSDVGKPLQCAVCGEKFRKNSTLSVHSKFAHALAGFDCKKCQTFFQIESEFIEHKTIHGTDDQSLDKYILSEKETFPSHEDGNINPALQKRQCDTDTSHARSVSEAVDDSRIVLAKQILETDDAKIQSSLDGFIFEDSEGSKPGSSNKAVVNNLGNDLIADLSPITVDTQGRNLYKTTGLLPVELYDLNANDSEDIYTMTEIGVDIKSKSAGASLHSDNDELKLPKLDGCKATDGVTKDEHAKTNGDLIDTKSTTALKQKNPQAPTNKKLSKHQCQYCDQTFRIPSTKQSHEIKEHTHDYFVCKICNKKLSNSPSFLHHMKTHKEDKVMYYCELCGKGFLYKNSLMTHKICLHTNVKPYMCSFCGMKFKLPNFLKRHEKLHKGVKYACSICGEKFKSTSARKIHVQDVHTGRKYPCKICGKLFRGSAPLREHELVHTGEKPHKCPMCDARFRRKHHVTQHLQRHYKGTA